ncbi:uncharacterized protein F5147DRAFT_774954 [Suillus discolor]|uniref:Uncharacterized protein n=1 Tax=Suillus discolor TaxID=1912936 RepID=A0A9P7F4T8_9AGAM|nr:uncharacterized protein F5147DRAFT_774954 [Suillus discolor]KAG2106143.1 hypothetical protein F5147DRAFT_774954 [Suillus discolor]
MAFTIEASVDPQVYVSEKEEQNVYVPENYHIPDGTTPNLETYMYYAKIQRDKEALSAKNDTEGGLWTNSDGKNVTPPSDEGGSRSSHRRRVLCCFGGS